MMTALKPDLLKNGWAPFKWLEMVPLMGEGNKLENVM
jgi:hypothetical protein